MTSAVPPEQLRSIATLARSNRLDEAAVLAAAAHARHPDDAMLAALAGAIEFHRGRFEHAIPYLQIAHASHARDLVVRTNLVEALMHVGRSADALRLCDVDAAKADPSMRLARLAGHLAQEAEDFDLAIALHRHILDRDAEDWAGWNNLGNALGMAGRFDEAAQALGKAAQLAPDAAPIRLNLCNALIDAERLDEAEAALRHAVADFPEDAKPLVALADFLRRSGREDESFEAMGRAARRAPDDAEILADYGQDAARRTEYALAETSYEAALALHPALGPAIVGLAALFERTNREAELDPLRDRAAASGVDEQSIAYIDALRFKRAGQFDEALAALEQAGDVVIAHRGHQLRGIMLDRLGDHDQAFAEFAAMNADRAAEPTRPLDQARAYRDLVVRDRAMLTPEWVASWTADTAARDRPDPVFLLGFPRSGTTLLDTMLMAAPDTLILEEEPFLSDAEHALGDMAGLADAKADQLAAMRAQYFERVATVGALGPDTLVIDKHPLHLNKVPAIRRLFPDARFILALRHPCDVLLSCFITNFRTNPGMSNFLALDTAAQLYDLSFDYWTKAQAVFDLPVKTVVYERLVGDTARELRPLFDYLGLAWPDTGPDHRIAARDRGIVRTASYAQVTEPIYTRSAGRWRRYERHLLPAIEKLRPWIDRFGYSVEDDRMPPWGSPSSAGFVEETA